MQEIVLPAPRTAMAILGAPFWVGLSILFVWGPPAAGSIGPQATVLLLLVLGLPGAYLVYEALYALFGHEALVLSDCGLSSERRVFGATTRRRSWAATDIQSITVRPVSAFEWFFRLNLTAGFDEGMVVLCVRGVDRRVGEGLRGERSSQALAEDLNAWLLRARALSASG